MTASNDITGDLIQTKSPSQQYRDNYDSIFRNSQAVEGNSKAVEGNSKAVEGKDPVQPELDLDGTGTAPDKPMVYTEEEHY